MVVLRKKCGDRKSYITGAGNGDIVPSVKNRFVYSRLIVLK